VDTSQGIALSGSKEGDNVNLEFVTSLVNRTVTLIGTSIAIFTFVLFFLYPRYASAEIDPSLFQITLVVIVLTIFSFAFSGFYFYGILGAREEERRKKLLRRGNQLFLLGLIFAISMPALILLTVGLELVSAIAMILFIVFVFEIVRQIREMPWLNEI